MPNARIKYPMAHLRSDAERFEELIMNETDGDRQKPDPANRMTVLVVGILALSIAVGGVWQATSNGGAQSPACSVDTSAQETLEVAQHYKQARYDLAQTEALGVVLVGQFGAYWDEDGGIICAIAFLNNAREGSDDPARYQAALAAIGEGDVAPALALLENLRDVQMAAGADASADAAAIVAHIGALWFYEDIGKSLEIYKEAVSLDAENGRHWFWVGNILRLDGQYDTAKSI